MASNFTTANPHSVDAFIRANETNSITAGEDIVDVTGIKLLAKSKPVSTSLQQRLLERTLKKPLEACLQVENGVTGVQLAEEAEKLVESSPVVAAIAGPHLPALKKVFVTLPLHSVVILLLTTARENGGRPFGHAVLNGLLSGALALGAKVAPFDVKLALLAGLLHDLGEMYVNPAYLHTDASLTPEGWRHVVVHPTLGAQLLSELTDYPKAIAHAVFEHHERLDGSGYPRKLTADKLSPVGRILAVTETLCGILDARDNPVARASLALRLVPGEYDFAVMSLLSPLRASPVGVLSIPQGFSAEQALQTMENVKLRLDAAALAAKDCGQAPISASQRDIAEMAARRIARLKFAWASTGVYDCFAGKHSLVELGEGNAEIYLDLEVVPSEMIWRMRALARSIVLALADLPRSGREEFEPMLRALDPENYKAPEQAEAEPGESKAPESKQPEAAGSDPAAAQAS